MGDDMKKTVLVLLSLLALTTQSHAAEFVPGELLVILKDGISSELDQSALARPLLDRHGIDEMSVLSQRHGEAGVRETRYLRLRGRQAGPSSTAGPSPDRILRRTRRRPVRSPVRR